LGTLFWNAVVQRETIKITQTTLARIARTVQTGADDDHEVADTVVAGLLIRVRKRTAKWVLRCRVKRAQHYFTIGSIVALTDPDLVREAAERAKAILREGGDPVPLFESLMQTPTVAAAEARAAHRAGKVWDWDKARSKFLDACRADNRPDTTRTYRSASGLVDLAGLKGKIITQIEPDDIRRIRDSIRARGKVAQSKLTMRTLKALFAWLVEQPDSGLKINPAKDVATSIKDRPAMLADAVAAADAFGSAQAEEELSVKDLQLLDKELTTAMPPSARFALQLAFRTVQRRLTAVSALKASFRPHDDYGMVWWVHPGLLKVGRNRAGEVRRHPHVIPLPPSAQQIVRTAMTMTRSDNPYLFPQLRLRKAGDPGDAHLSERLLNAALADLQKPGRPLHRVQHFSTHAFRGWFTTHVRRLGFTKADTKLILDHAEGRTRDTTDEHYDWEQSLPEKYRILCAWEKLIIPSPIDLISTDQNTIASEYVDTGEFGMSSEIIVPGK
jgi:integrase